MAKWAEKETTYFTPKAQSIEVEVALIKQDVNTIKESTREHNQKTDRDFELIHKKIDKIDNRLWWLGGVIIVATVEIGRASCRERV